MNKYSKALDIIKRDYAFEDVSKKEFPTIKDVEVALETLQELVDKENKTLEEIEKIIDRRTEKANHLMSNYVKTSTNYLIYKGIIIELKHFKEYIVKRKNKGE